MTMPPEGEFLKAMGIDPATVHGDSTFLVHLNDNKSVIYYTGLKVSNDREALDAALASSGADIPVKTREEVWPDMYKPSENPGEATAP